MKVALYARVSTLGQGEEDKASIPEQISRIERYCQEKGYTVADRYVDIGFSGAKSKRPEFQRMLSDAKNSRFNAIVCWKADRLSRGMYPAAALMEVIEPLGISLEAVEEHLDMNYFAMLAVVGKMELDNIRARTRMGHEARANKGKMEGRAPFGYSYNRETGRYEVYEEEAGIVRWIFKLYSQGTPVRQIAAKLNLLHIPTKEHSKLGWTTNKVNSVLSRRFYYGEGYYNRVTQATGKRKMKKRECWISLEYPAIIPRETFECALTRKVSNKQLNPRRTKHCYMLRGILFCEECGKHFCVTSRGKTNKKRLSDGTIKVYQRNSKSGGYECRGSREYPHIYNCRTPKQISSLEIDSLVWNKLDETLRNPTLLRLAIETRQETLRDEMVNGKERIEKVNKNIKRCGCEEQWIITQARKCHITEEQMVSQLNSVRDEKAYWEEELHKIHLAEALKIKQEDILEQAQKVCSHLVSKLDQLVNSTDRETLEERRAITLLLVDRVTVNREGQVTIQFAIPEPEDMPTFGALKVASS